MISGSNMNGMTEYGVDSTYKTLPTGSAWSDGVVPEKTLPAAWWNAILGLFSKNLNQSKLNLDNIVAELNNILSINSTTPNPAATDQLKTFINNFLRNADNLSAGTVPQARLSAAILLTLLKTVDGSGSGLDADTVDGSHYNANDILAKLLTVDGADSGLDADLLDGVDSSRIIYGSGVAGINAISDCNDIDKSGFYVVPGTGYNAPTGTAYLIISLVWPDQVHRKQLAFDFGTSGAYIRRRTAGTWSAWEKLWNAGNDGAGSGLDADLLDGLNSDRFVYLDNGTQSLLVTDANAITKSGLQRVANTAANLPVAQWGTIYTNIWDVDGATQLYIALGSTTFPMYMRYKASRTWSAWKKFWNEANDGSGSGLDADTVDGIDSTRIIYGDSAYGSTNITGSANNIVKSGFYRLPGDVGTDGPEAGITYHLLHIQNGVSENFAVQHAYQAGAEIKSYIRVKNISWGPWQKLWNAGNDGSGSGLDADLLDGLNSTAFATAAQGTKADNALPSASYTAADVLTKIKAVDGPDSGLDADLWDAVHRPRNFGVSGDGGQSVVYSGDVLTTLTKIGDNGVFGPDVLNVPTNTYYSISLILGADTVNKSIFIAIAAGASAITWIGAKSGTTITWHSLWNDANDGFGSGLDADLLDGYHWSDLFTLDGRAKQLKPVFGMCGQVGSGLTISNMGYPAIAALNSTDIAFIDGNSDLLRTYRWNGSTWSQVGSGLTISNTGYPAITALNSTDIAFIDNANDSLRLYRWNGSTWSQVGSGLAISGVSVPAITTLNSTDIAFIDSYNGSLRTYRWNGSTWSQVGSGLSMSVVGAFAITTLNSTDIAFIDGGNGSLRTYRWNGSTWSQVGNGLTLTAMSSPAIAALNSTDIAFIDSANDSLRVYRWSGSTWSQVGNGLTLTAMSSPAIAALNSTDIAFIDGYSAFLRVYAFN